MNETISPEWRARIDAEQEHTTELIAGEIVERVRYGVDYPAAPAHCRDCAVERGQLHVASCCVERCGKCGAQAISCDCLDLYAE